MPVATLERRLMLLSIVVGIALLAAKFTAFALTDSSAVYSDALESVVNVLASTFAFYAIQVAHRPADNDHPYGHGKIEFLASGFEGGLIILAAILMAYRAIGAWIDHAIFERLGIGLVIVLAAGLINGGLGLVLLRIGRRTGSVALRGDGHHLISDFVTSIGLTLALLLVIATDLRWLDPVIAIALSIYLLFTGLRLMKQSIDGLMDKQDDADTRAVEAILQAHMGDHATEPIICSYHKLRHRHAGRYHWVDFHCVVTADMNIARGHAIASHIEHEIEQALGDGNATAHIEPCLDPTCPACSSRLTLASAASSS